MIKDTAGVIKAFATFLPGKHRRLLKRCLTVKPFCPNDIDSCLYDVAGEREERIVRLCALLKGEARDYTDLPEVIAWELGSLRVDPEFRITRIALPLCLEILEYEIAEKEEKKCLRKDQLK